MDNRIIGNIGESAIVSLCHSVGIVATKPSEDIHGWDLYLEFPKKVDTSLPNDSQPSAIKAKIQVKTTTSRKRKISINVSALEHLVNVQMPAFICFIELKNSIEIENMYLVHIDEEITSKVLKSIRECELNNKKINKTTITIHYKNEHKLESNTGDCIQKKIKNYIPNGMKSYISEKNNILEKVGFDERPHNLTIQFQGISISDIEDISLGLKDGDLECSITNSTQSRFDIELPDKTLPKSDKVKISVEPQYIGEATISFKASTYAIPSLEYKFNVYKSAFATGKENMSKLLFKNDYMELVYDFKTNEQKFSTKLTNRTYKLNELHQSLQLYNFAYQSKDTPLIMEIRAEGLKEPVRHEFQFGDLSKNMNLNYFYLTDALSKILKDLNLADTFEITLEELLSQESHIKIFYALLLHDNLNDINFKCTVDKEIQQSKVPLIFIPNITFNSQIIGVATILLCTVEKDNDKYSCKPISKNLYKNFAIPVNEYKEEYFSTLKDEMNKQMEEQGYELSYVL